VKFEPARIIAAATALLTMAAAFGLGISDQQSAAIVAAVAAVLQVFVGEAIRSKVYPAGTVEQVAPALADPVEDVPFSR
jgi:hypothetical protein